MKIVSTPMTQWGRLGTAVLEFCRSASVKPKGHGLTSSAKHKYFAHANKRLAFI
jgi:hypothetical protein